ncbi:glyoxylate reductase [Sinobaca qinghaiensis]|uniref:Glyoxylate reductase n=1 Tax=Sinobaca qinghaiensis TaxID=342944 RepID=A0A419V6T5_9BACL|nr:D-glycerate dehydrogenase [Sinobaca qinghaiensis]RKD75561.1 glyoxylate reductase [Sinobaca qinghaiensis]
MKPYVFIARKMPEEIVNKLADRYEVGMWEKEEEPVPKERLAEECQKADAVFCTITEAMSGDMLRQSPKLKVIATMAVGYNNIDIETAAELGIKVAHTPEVLTETTADLTFALLMAAARRVEEAALSIKQNQWSSWSPFHLTGRDVFGATLGIIGMGRIGEAVARRAAGFNMEVLYHNRSRKKEAEDRLGVIYTGKNELIERADFLCVMAPYSKDTHHLIGKEEFRRMKPTAILINSSRGGVVDEKALYQALQNKEITGAGLDVFENEPIDSAHPLLELSNVTATPHIGSASVKTRMAMAHMTADHILQALSGEELTHRVV